MATITGTGLGSGLDINSIVKSLVDAQSAPKTAQLDRLKSQTDAKISGVGQLQSALEAFQKAMKDLGAGEAFNALAATSSKAEQITVSAANNAVAGSYQVKINQLATASKVATGFTPSSGTFNAGSLTISLGSSNDFTVDIAEGASLVEVRDAINTKLKDKGVTANVVSDPANPQAGSRLILSSTVTGAGKDISVLGSNVSLAQLNVDGTQQQQGSGAGYITKAQNAEFEIDGLALSSATNKVEGAVSGLTFELLAEGVGKTTTLTVGPNKTGLKDSIQKFVDAYNQVVKVTSSLTKVTKGADGTTTTSGALVGDSTVRQMMNILRKELTTSSDTGNDAIKILADLGIKTQNDGTLSIEQSKLDKVIQNSPETIGAFFNGTDGLFKRLDNQIKTYTQTGGILKERSESLQGTLTNISKQRDAHTRAMAALEDRLYAQYNAMDNLVGQLTSTGNSLLSSLDALAARSKS
ncbi:flagellar filament capping protein FliD [Pseudomonas sp. JM0905a]|uniref:flagellar filament capping protein FliD n=1 Tax=Pseudomonas sp. JM0905a TaxID=2772484 RepID=UPI001688BC68|nr:flagellar filament capping protein FliD [Pseudomonas sp. JM0905a]MBD2837637.1 flagellar filament capping protein FliD [Pseudomonas sp. JM0905a]